MSRWTLQRYDVRTEAWVPAEILVCGHGLQPELFDSREAAIAAATVRRSRMEPHLIFETLRVRPVREVRP